MCSTCWEEHGRPANWSPQIAAALALVDELYGQHSTGGPLHAELDDWNVDEPMITPWVGGDFDPATMELAQRIADAFNAMTVADRVSVLAYHRGLATPG